MRYGSNSQFEQVAIAINQAQIGTTSLMRNLTITFSPVYRVGASVSRPYSSANAGAAAMPRVNATANAEVATALESFEAAWLSVFPAAARAVPGYARAFPGENALTEPVNKRTHNATAGALHRSIIVFVAAFRLHQLQQKMKLLVEQASKVEVRGLKGTLIRQLGQVFWHSSQNRNRLAVIRQELSAFTCIYFRFRM